MSKFQPYLIRHLPLSGINTFEPPKQNSFLVFWWKNLPLGHLWVDSSNLDMPIFRFRELVVNTISPALEYYLDSTEWHTYLLGLLKEAEESTLTEELECAFKETFLAKEPAPATGPISVVICTRNRPQALKNCIEGLMLSSDKNFELVVVDNAPDDQQTHEVVKQFDGVKYVWEPRKGLDIARNTGAKNASHKIVAYTDDDVYVDHEWIKNIKVCFSDPLTMAVTGLVLPAELNTRSQYIFEKHWGFNRGYKPIIFDHEYFTDNLPYGVPVWNIGAGANMAFRKEAFELCGYFDERLDVGASGCSGDSEMWYRILAEGWNCNYFPKAVVYHQHRSSAKDLTKQIFNYMRGQVSSLMVQYENYGHEGNIYRAKEGLKDYYRQRLRTFFKGCSGAQMGTWLTEVRGCLSGWKFYQQHKDKRRIDEVEPHPSLSKEVKVEEDTLVSVVIPCYNQGNYLEEALMSVYNQTYTNVEIVIVDDGSTDNTAEICAKYKEAKYVRVSRVGLSAARNIGAMYSTGSFLMFLDADDILYPNAIELNLYYFKQYPWAVFVSGGHDKINDEGSKLDSIEPIQKIGDNYKALLQGNYIGMQGTVMYRREVFPAFHFDTKLRACEDYDLNLRLARHFSCVSHTNRIAGYRMHLNNMSKDKKMMYDMAITVLKKQERSIQKEDELQDYQLGFEYWKNYYNEEKIAS